MSVLPTWTHAMAVNLALAGSPSAEQGAGQVGNGRLRRPVGPEQPVGFLVGVGQLRPAGADEAVTVPHRVPQLAVAPHELVARLGPLVAPCSGVVRGCEGDAPELRQHHGAPVTGPVEGGPAAVRSP